MERYLNLAHRIVYRLNIPDDEHEEAMGVAILAGTEALATFDAARGIPEVAYLSQRITWRLKDWMRRENVRATTAMPAQYASWDTAPERIALAREEIDDVLAAMDDVLNDRDRTLILARAFGYSSEEICAALSITSDQSRMFLRYARTRLRRRIEARAVAVLSSSSL